MSADRIEPDYDAVPFPSDSSRSRPSLHDMYQNFQRGPVPAPYPVFRTPVYDDPNDSGPGARRTASPHTLVAPRSTAYSHYPGPHQHTVRPNTIDAVETVEPNPPGRYIPWNDDRRGDLEEGLEKLSQSKDPIQEEKKRFTAAEAEYERLQAMDTKEREKYLKKRRVEYHVTCGCPQAKPSRTSVDLRLLQQYTIATTSSSASRELFLPLVHLLIVLSPNCRIVRRPWTSRRSSCTFRASSFARSMIQNSKDQILNLCR